MDNLPVISIVTVTMNDFDGLVRTAESIAQQDYELIQHIIVDGGSSDGTAEWLATYQPTYAARTISEPDDGIFDAMNKGASLASGDLLIFMNSADVFATPTVLSQVATNWSEVHWKWAYGQLEYLSENLVPQGRSRQVQHAQRALELGLKFAPHQATFMDTTFFQQLGGFNLKFDYACDQELAIRAGLSSDPVIFDFIVAKFLLGGTHSQTTYWRREMIYHRMRSCHAALVGNMVFADLTYTYAMAGYREARKYMARFVQPALRKTMRTNTHDS